MTKNFSEVPDSEVLDNEDIITINYGEELQNSSEVEGFQNKLGSRVKLGRSEMEELKLIVDKEINTNFTKQDFFTITYDKLKAINGLTISTSSPKLQMIAVTIESIDNRILVKVGPCDLSGVGGHKVREEIIKNLVDQALAKKGLDKKSHTFETVNVSACVGVRGRMQMAVGFFVNNRDDNGTHMNAYVKTANEQHLTHWEPRQGPQRFFNDTICAMVTSVATSLFEKGIRTNEITKSDDATNKILKNPSLLEIFDHILSVTKDRINTLVSQIKSLSNFS